VVRKIREKRLIDVEEEFEIELMVLNSNEKKIIFIENDSSEELETYF
jgi:hypothetical protein